MVACGMTVILTVEDELLIGDYLGSVLEEAGYEVIATANADEAIAVLETRNDIRILITDIDMPGSMDGLKLAAAVRGRWPPIKIIIATGKGKPGSDQMPALSQFVPKPYIPERILAAVRRAQ
jgi:CheY-like chemotaxis protein